MTIENFELSFPIEIDATPKDLFDLAQEQHLRTEQVSFLASAPSECHNTKLLWYCQYHQNESLVLLDSSATMSTPEKLKQLAPLNRNVQQSNPTNESVSS
eukprot:TRINITY_DN5471_c0_g1_i2.p2 TRINITY_DN5471_c0_g1~~TRINITY_DN5471_c0_g1_i2.p2  ORF type:complete len:100 (+),score=19.00 TRINITY_DN5471_c0_g1_i2:248-547(+)